MKSFLKEHLAFSVYLWILLFLNIGVITYTGMRHLDKMLIVTTSFLAFYFVIGRLLRNKSIKFKSIAPEKIKYLEIGLICLALLIFLADLIALKGLPGLHLFSTTTVEQTTSLRQDIHLNSPKILVYLSGFNIRGFFPFLIMYFLIRRQSIAFTVFAILGAFYAFGFLQKSLIIFMFLPSIVVAIHQRKYLHFFLMSFS
ncbi:MAG: hypothetical protein H6599_10440 [Flavobacteriales bacterium]|nr:hypothetical protein [Flavobacteriales bacterium]